ncbi:hypothetical protein BO78DRAFT_440801 [Aspergillus sclerotiicarbonarius CBS 121057]|uniref:Uncharacterized protein n=1 Tax=Aspergillus sclerotiicarbonarius (strain CBS 121057 / IBT 28362) TaxID=1448318 RepID=A0A319ENL9_ASPSB|nr:hypothetical protein BO78DRAFT_440801 [Aspergillus sclerotiicarbonarius CBS 121057]
MASKVGQSSAHRPKSRETVPGNRCDQSKYPGIGYTTHWVINIQKSNANLAGCLGLKCASEVHALYFGDPVTQPIFDDWLRYRRYLNKTLSLNDAPLRIDGLSLFERYEDLDFEPILDAKHPPRLGKHKDVIKRDNIITLGVLWYVHKLVKGKRDLFQRSEISPGSDGLDHVTFLSPYDLLHGWKLLSRKMYNLEDKGPQPAKAKGPIWCDCDLHKGKARAGKSPDTKAVVNATQSMVNEVENVSDEMDVDDEKNDPNYETESVVYTTEEMSCESEDAGEPPEKAGTSLWERKYNEGLFGPPTPEKATGKSIWDIEDNLELFCITPEKEDNGGDRAA